MVIIIGRAAPNGSRNGCGLLLEKVSQSNEFDGSFAQLQKRTWTL
jgi:hypothetical protein